MPFLTEPVPPFGDVVSVAAGVVRIVAPNTGPTTYHGTNSYLIDHGGDGLILLDPGPDEPTHVSAILRAAADPITAILVTHRHADHYGACAALRAATGAPVYAFADEGNPVLVADRLLADGDALAGLTAIHTPGHAPDHLCFARSDGVIFSGDHVMSWSSTVVSPPRGDMAAYLASLRRVARRDDCLLLPGHGPPLADPRTFIEDLLAHRLGRETDIVTLLSNGPATAEEIARRLYAKQHPRLQLAAERNVVSHLGKLAVDGVVEQHAGQWRIVVASSVLGHST